MKRRPRPSIGVFVLLLGLAILACSGYYRLASYSGSASRTSSLPEQKLEPSRDKGKISDKMTSTSSESIGTSLGRSKKAFLDRLSQPEDDSSPFVVIMGNEAGDTDSLASSIMLSYLLSDHDDNEHAQKFPKSTTFVPLQQLPRSDLKLRAENEMLLSLLKIDASNLLYFDDLPTSMKPRKDVHLGLTDHPQLSALWQPYDEWKNKVEIIVDHHADDGAHKDARIRIMRGPENGAIGSCVSVIIDMFKKTKMLQKLPSELADLALAALLIDTNDVSHFNVS